MRRPNKNKIKGQKHLAISAQKIMKKRSRSYKRSKERRQLGKSVEQKEKSLTVIGIQFQVGLSIEKDPRQQPQRAKSDGQDSNRSNKTGFGGKQAQRPPVWEEIVD
jgi:hypothetical protein